MKKQQLAINNFGGYFLILCVATTLILLYRVLEPFIIDLVFAAILTSVCFPIYNWILNKLNGHRRWASLLACFFIITVILIPIGIFIYQFIIQAAEAISTVYTKIETNGFAGLDFWNNSESFNSIREYLLPVFDINKIEIDTTEIQKNITETLRSAASGIWTQITTFLTNIALFLFHFSIIIVSMFFFFKDSETIINKIKHLSPLPTKHNDQLIFHFRQISQATMLGIFLTAMIQGFLGGIGFVIVGIPNPIFWGTLMSFFALIPFIGTTAVWGPAAIYLLLSNQITAGVFLLFWGAGIVGTIDNFLRPYFIHGKARTYPLFIFLSILGGLTAFGILGIILGPLILTLASVFINIYEVEYNGLLDLKDKESKISPKRKNLVHKILSKLKKKK